MKERKRKREKYAEKVRLLPKRAATAPSGCVCVLQPEKEIPETGFIPSLRTGIVQGGWRNH